LPCVSIKQKSDLVALAFLGLINSDYFLRIVVFTLSLVADSLPLFRYLFFFFCLCFCSFCGVVFCFVLILLVVCFAILCVCIIFVVLLCLVFVFDSKCFSVISQKNSSLNLELIIKGFTFAPAFVIKAILKKRSLKNFHKQYVVQEQDLD